MPEKIEPIPIGKARVHREGEDVTVIATGRLVHESLKAAEEAEKEGISVEVVDPRTLQPLDEETLVASVKKTNRAVVAHEAVTRMGFGAEVASVLQYQAFDWLDAPIERVGAKFTPLPFAPVMEQFVVPHADDVLAGDLPHRRTRRTMATEVKLPRLGQGMESGTIVKWLKSEGDPVEKGEPLYELDTDKVTQEVEAEASGVLLKIAVTEGEVEVGQDDRLHRRRGRGGRRRAEPQPTRSRRSARGAERASPSATQAARPQPRRGGAAAPSSNGRANGRIKASPLARRIARERGDRARADLAAPAPTAASSPRTSSARRRAAPAAPRRRGAERASRVSVRSRASARRSRAA